MRKNGTILLRRDDAGRKHASRRYIWIARIHTTRHGGQIWEGNGVEGGWSGDRRGMDDGRHGRCDESRLLRGQSEWLNRFRRRGISDVGLRAIRGGHGEGRGGCCCGGGSCDESVDERAPSTNAIAKDGRS